MYNSDKNIENLVDITETFIEFLNKLYRDGVITYEQFCDMTITKNEFIKNIKLLDI